MLNVAVLFFARPGFFLPFGHGVSPSGGVWDACPARGKGGLLGAAPLLGPLCTPPGAPPKKRFQFSSGNEGNASPAAGASLPRCARSGDLPPRRVNARGGFRFDQHPLQPNTSGLAARLGNGFALFSHDFWVFSHHQARTNHESKQKLAPHRQDGCDKGKFHSAMTRREVCESKKIFSIKSSSWSHLP